MASLSSLPSFQSIVDEIHNKVMADLAANSTLTNVNVDLTLTYTRKPGTNDAQIQVKAAERRTNYQRQVVGTVTTTS